MAASKVEQGREKSLQQEIVTKEWIENFRCVCVHTHCKKKKKVFIFYISLLQRIANTGGLKCRRVLGLER